MQIGTNVLRQFLNALIETQLRIFMGRELHNLGAHEERALSPYEENDFGVLRSLSEDLCRHIRSKKLAYIRWCKSVK